MFLKKGIITQDDIEGNVSADKLAFEGADAHDNITESIADMHDKLQVTVVVQKMLLSVWEVFIQNDGECNLADQQDLEEMERMMNLALFEAQMDDDYDPFENDSNDVVQQKSPTDVTPDATKHDTSKSELEPKAETCLEDQCNFKRFPDYGWYHVNSAHDDAINISTPHVNDTNGLNKVVVMNVRTYELERNGEKSHKTFTKYYIPMGWWEPMISLIKCTKWSIFGLCDGSNGVAKQCLRSTWVELAIIFQLQTGYRIRDQLDLGSMERCFCTAFRKIMNLSTTFYKGKKTTLTKIVAPCACHQLD